MDVPPSPFGTEGSFKASEGKFYARNSNCLWTVSGMGSNINNYSDSVSKYCLVKKRPENG